jgi:hypothetical protein
MNWRWHSDTIVPGLTALVCLAALWRVAAVIWLHVPLDPNEGWNAYHAAAAMGAGPLYPDPHAYMVNNYPPLSFYIVGLVGVLIGDNIIAGRVVSLLSVAAIMAGMYAVARRMGAKRTASCFAPLFFATGLLLTTDYVGMDDPQLMAHAVATSALLIVVSEPRGRAQIASAAFLFVVAFFIKHNVVAAAIAATLWLVLRDRRSGVQLAALGIGFAFAGLALFHLAYGRSLVSVVVTARSYSFDQLWSSAVHWLYWTLIPLAGLGVLAVRRWREPQVQLCALYAVVAGGIGLYFLGGAGVDPNVLFDADIALGLSTALVLDRLTGWRGMLVGAAYAAPLYWLAATNAEWRDPQSWSHPLREEAATAGKDITMMASRPGPALCEMQSFCYWAGKPPAVDVFNVGQQFDTGARSDAELVAQIDARRFGVIQFDPDSPYSLGENVHNAMARAYRPQHEDDFGSFYVPR